VPVLVLGGNPSREIGSRSSFSDVGASVAAHLNIPAVSNGRAF
jgi:phosphopentomutase